jgi:hypothetical protein
MADASLPEMRARNRPGTAIAAMMPMIATTMSNSMRVKPLVSRIRMLFNLPKNKLRCLVSDKFDDAAAMLGGVRLAAKQQRLCQQHGNEEGAEVSLVLSITYEIKWRRSRKH